MDRRKTTLYSWMLSIIHSIHTVLIPESQDLDLTISAPQLLDIDVDSSDLWHTQLIYNKKKIEISSTHFSVNILLYTAYIDIFPSLDHFCNNLLHGM